jgi:DNA-directed RNA polymerase specialized sigma24 family protein
MSPKREVPELTPAQAVKALEKAKETAAHDPLAHLVLATALAEAAAREVDRWLLVAADPQRHGLHPEYQHAPAREIAEALGITTQAVHQRLATTRKRAKANR